MMHYEEAFCGDIHMCSSLSGGHYISKDTRIPTQKLILEWEKIKKGIPYGIITASKQKPILGIKMRQISNKTEVYSNTDSEVHITLTNPRSMT